MVKIKRLLLIVICLGNFILPNTLQAQLHHANQDLPCINKNYNILAHVAVDSTDRAPLYATEKLDTMIMKLNAFFSPICVSFSLCEFNVLENDYSLGRVVSEPITKEEQLLELKTRFTLRRRINIFFLDYITNENCGSSTFKGILTQNDANIYIEKACIDSLAEQVAHHLGHTFGLRNTYDRTTIELVDGSNCTTTGDFICDTPADPFEQSSILNATPAELDLIAQNLLDTSFYSGSSCEFIYELRDPNGQYYQPDMGNIMSAYPCKCGFTQDQFRLMAETILASTIRHF